MLHSNILVVLAALLMALLTAKGSLAQTCNPNIPLRAPDSGFTDQGDGTVTHHSTGLMWMQCLEGQSGADCTGTPTAMTWSEALVHASNRGFAGYSDWRLPNIKELASIVEDSCFDPAINLSLFPNDQGSDVWSASPQADFSDSVWGLNFNYGDDLGLHKGYYGYIRVVRDVQ